MATHPKNVITRQQFLQNLLESPLSIAPAAAGLMASLPPALAQADGETIAREFVSRQWLTHFQADRILTRFYIELCVGNYEFLDRIGAGGMGTVYRAKHRRMNRIVAIKVLSRIVAESDEFIQRFQREIETIARLQHPNIVMAFDADEAELGHYLVLEFVDGQDLATVVYQQGPLNDREALESALQAARGLAYAHLQGIIHRDVKPANLLRDRSGIVKVADLGLARFQNRNDTSMDAITQLGGVLGTVDYMPPEQAMDLLSIDFRADVYSLGCTLHYLLTGRPPYAAPTMMATMLKHREAPIPQLGQVGIPIRPEWQPILDRMLAKDRDHRYPTMDAVVEVLEKFTDVLMTPLEKRSSSRLTSLPLPAPPLVSIGHTVSDSMLSSGLRILTVEPSRTQSSIIRRFCTSYGLDASLTATTVEDAIAMVVTLPPTVVICAMQLHDGTGIDLAKAIAENSPPGSLGFILVTSSGEITHAASLPRSHPSIVLPKPFNALQLAAAIAVVTDGYLPPLPPVWPSDYFARCHVLVADDSVVARRYEIGLLRDLGFVDFTEAEDGVVAIQRIDQQRYDLVITDYNMPMASGGDLVKHIRGKGLAMPIMMVTSEPDQTKLATVRLAGVTAILDKRLSPVVMRAVLAAIVRPE